MDDSQPNSTPNMFSLRIVSIDYYMAPPIPPLDISYSSFQGGKVNEVPVIRIYGSTPAGQKTCLHIHRALPYFYVPCRDLFTQLDERGDAHAHALSQALEKGLKLKGSVGSKRQHIHSCSVVRAKKFYGYHSSEEPFMKIYLYHPQDVSRAANLLLGGAVLDKVLQPHESHIPFLLQFMVDYNLYGMGHIHLSKLKFRNPVPQSFSQKITCGKGYQGEQKDETIHIVENSKAATFCNSPIWQTSTIPDSWIWQIASHPCSASDQGSSLVNRQSTCELEGDAVVEEILNQQSISYTSLSQTHSEIKMVPSLVPIWEEFERSGMQAVAIPPDPGKPAPSDVLRMLWSGNEFRDRLMELSNDEESLPKSLTNTSPKGDLIVPDLGILERYTKEPMGSSYANELRLASHSSSFQGCSPKHNEDLFGSQRMPSDQPSQSDVKASDHDALRLLKWLASSQAAEDINSDDELSRDTILSPLLPAATINNVLERANMDYESETQRECQDILDMVQDGLSFKEDDRKSSSSTAPTNSCSSFSTDTIPQVDGSSDESPQKDTPSKCNEIKNSPSSPYQNNVVNRSTGCKKKTPKWGSLPIASGKILFDSSVHQSVLDPAFGSETDIKNSSETCVLIKGKAGKSLVDIEGNTPSNFCQKKGTSGHSEPSMRDLMRKKRSYKMEQAEAKTAAFENCSIESMRTEDGSPSPEPRNDIQDSLASSTFRLSTADTQTGFKRRNISTEHLKACNTTPAIGGDSMHVKSPRGINCSAIPSSILKDDSQPSGEGYYKDPEGQGSAEPLKYAICSSFQSNKKTDSILKPHKADDTTVQMCSRFDEAPILGTSFNGMNSIRMKFHNQPPNIEWEDIKSSQPSNILHEEVNVSPFAPLESQDESLPFFTPEHSIHHEFQLSETNDYHVNGVSTMGVPLHCKNDGSYLYMLTPKFCPPSSEAVSRELSVDDMGTHKTIISTEQELTSPKGSFTEDVVLLGSEPNVYDPLLQTASVSDLEHVRVDKGSVMRNMISLDDTNRILHDEGNNMRCETSVGHSDDISQISGPESRLKLTPLSQIGFRDSANVSGGQQLTLLSIEILADSRGDLRPDPRFDAINLVVFVFQEDNECKSDVHILMRCISETTDRNLDGMSGCKVFVFSEEKLLLNHFMKVICSSDPDILLGWDVQRESLGYLAERSAILGFNLLNGISRTPSEVSIGSENLQGFEKENLVDMLPEPVNADTAETTVIVDEWGRTHASGVHVNGRIVLNVWRLMRGEVKLNFYTLEAVAEAVLRRKVPSISFKLLARWFTSGPGHARYRCIDYIVVRTKLNLQITNQLDIINRTSELARVFGIDFFSVLSRGSQYRVESMFLRLAHTQNYLAISPGNGQVASQPAMECLPLVMEPESGFYADPVVVLDFQSLYPSMIIGYNLCYCTCLGKVVPSKADTLGVISYSPDKNILQNLKHEMLITPNGVMYVPSKVRKGVLPRLLEEILSTRIMVKQAMKKLEPSQQILHRVFDARQLALKLIANVTYGYTAAGFSGRMPCAELADSIVQCGRRTLETAISFVNAHPKWQAKVIYGDTDSMFVLLKGRSVKEAFQIGHEIAAAITEMNPYPVALKMDKVYHPCFLLTKKRYVGYSYENPDQSIAKFDAKGIETVRRDTCMAVSKMMEQSLRVFFEQKDIEKVKAYVLRQWKRILSGRVPLQDFIFAKEVRLGTYSSRSSSLPPAAIVASKAMRADSRAEPLYAERVPYIVVHGEPGARLIDMVVDPQELLAIDSPYRLNDMYYIKKQIIPALQRAFGLVGADLNQWLLGMPRPRHEAVGKSRLSVPSAHRTRIEYYYLSKHCILCDAMVQGSAHLCRDCSRNEATVALTLTGKTSKLERDIQHLAAICRQCGGGDWLLESGIKCTSLACSVYYERRKVQKELRSLSAVASETGFYPKCMVEYF